jgi:hypothetical protein
LPGLRITLVAVQVLPTKLKYIENYAQHAQVIVVLVMMFVGIIVLKKSMLTNVLSLPATPAALNCDTARHSVCQGWTIGRRISYCDINLYHFLTVHLSDPRHDASVKSKVEAGGCVAILLRALCFLCSRTAFRSPQFWKNFLTSSAFWAKLHHTLVELCPLRCPSSIFSSHHPPPSHLPPPFPPRVAGVAAWNAGLAARAAAGQPF